MSVVYSIPGFSDPISSISHLIGLAVFLVLSFFLLRHSANNAWKLITLGVFCFAALFMLAMSGVYHLLSPGTTGREVLQRLDHAAIFILIVGTMTPIHQMLFRGFMRWGWLLLLWLVAVTALVLKVVFFESFPEWLGLTLYLSLGWLGAVTGIVLWYRNNVHFIKPLFYGGGVYTLGGVLEFLQKPILIQGVLGAHELLHIAVLIGLGFHWRFIHKIART